MSECLGDEIIAGFLDGGLETERLARVEAHLADCVDCRRVLADAAHAGRAPVLERGDIVAEKYQVERHIGRGGMGDVFAAQHLELGHRVAIKVLLGENSSGAEARFLREARACARLDNPHVVRVFDFGRLVTGAPYIVMEYLVGEDLAAVVARGPVAAPEAIAHALAVCSAMAAAHEAGIVHRDLKPANLFLARQSDGACLLKVLDFGISKLASSGDAETVATQTSPGAWLGSPLYMSPEQLEPDADLDSRSDIWSLGVILHELLSGRPPFRARTLAALLLAIASQPPPPLTGSGLELPEGLEAVVRKCLEKAPDARFGSARELAAALLDVASGNYRGIVAEPSPSSETTPFVGRESELNELARALGDGQNRLLTILAPGGMGKSRLALEASRRLRDGVAPFATKLAEERFADGVAWVQLAPLNSPDFILGAIASAVRFQPYPEGDAKQQLLDYFADRKILLVLDNFERLLAGGSLVTELLRAAPGLSVLVTSRERLQVSQERCLVLRGLDFPSAERPSEVQNSASGQLLLAGARRARTDFELTSDQLLAAARICQLVQGMPLAVLLAAAWLDVLSLDEVAKEIERSLDLLHTDLRDVPERQRSIQAVFDHSWASLCEADQRVLARLAVFRGGFTADAAQRVAAADLRALADLCKRSLVQRAESSARYEMHELLRQYADARLRALPSLAEQTLDGHAGYFAEFLRARAERLKSKRGAEAALAEIALEFDNVRSAWSRALQRHHLDELAKILAGLDLVCWHQWWLAARFDAQTARIFRETTETLRVRFADAPVAAGAARVFGAALEMRATHIGEDADEQLRLVTEALSLLDETRYPRERARALIVQAEALADRARLKEALASAEEALHLCRRVGDAFDVSLALHRLATVYDDIGDLRSSESAYRESLTVGAGLPDEYVRQQRLRLSLLVLRQRPAEGRQLLRAAVAESEAGGSVSDQIFCAMSLAEAEVRFGNLAAAEEHARNRLRLAQEVGYRDQAVFARIHLGAILSEAGKFSEARQELEAALESSERKGNTPFVSFSLGLLATAARLAGQHAEAEAYELRRSALPQELWQEFVWSQLHLGDIMKDQGRYAEAQDHFRAALRRSSEMGADRAVAISNMNLGEVAGLLGDPAQARALLLQSLQELERLDDPESAAWALLALSEQACAEGDQRLACGTFRRVIAAAAGALRRPSGHGRLVLRVITGMAHVHAKSGRPERAAELLALVGSSEVIDHYLRRWRVDPLSAKLEQELGRERFERATELGRALDLETTLSALDAECARIVALG